MSLQKFDQSPKISNLTFFNKPETSKVEGIISDGCNLECVGWYNFNEYAYNDNNKELSVLAHTETIAHDMINQYLGKEVNQNAIVSIF